MQENELFEMCGFFGFLFVFFVFFFIRFSNSRIVPSTQKVFMSNQYNVNNKLLYNNLQPTTTCQSQSEVMLSCSKEGMSYRQEIQYKKSVKIPKMWPEVINRRRAHNKQEKKKDINIQIKQYKEKQRSRTRDQPKPGSNNWCSGRAKVPVPHLSPVVLLLLHRCVEI